MKEKTKLEKLLNRDFIYKQENIHIKDFFMNDDNETVNIITDKKPIKIKVSEVDKFCNDLLSAEQGMSIEVTQQTNGLLLTLQQTLLDNIEQVKKDKNYIKQANVINSSVNALIGMAKLQIQVGKMTNK